MNTRWFFFFSAFALLLNCTFDPPTCSGDGDCDDGSSCVFVENFQEKTCLNTDGFPKSNSDSGNPDGDSQDGFFTDAKNNKPNNQSNGLDPDSGTPDASVDMSKPDIPQPTVCTVDPFDSTCTDDNFERNNMSFDRHPITNNVTGCNNAGENFEPLAISLNAVLCSIDNADWFGIRYNACNIRKQLTIRVIPGRECTGAEYDLLFDLYDCSETNVRCVLKENGIKEISLLLPSSSQSVDNFAWVVADRSDAEFEYRMEIELAD